MSDDAPSTQIPLTLDALVQWAEDYAHILYHGELVEHRSCGIAVAETFGLETTPYQSLRKGGITGCGECGAIKAGELVLGQLLGDPSPTGGVTDALRTAAFRYRELWQERVERGQSSSIICNDLTGQFDVFRSPERAQFCTSIASTVAGCVAQTLTEANTIITPMPLPTDAHD